MSRIKSAMEQCPQCFGTWPPERPCDVCGGTGFVWIEQISRKLSDREWALDKYPEMKDEALITMVARFREFDPTERIRPNSKPQTSDQMKRRADRIRDMATGSQALGREVKPEYRNIDLTENYE